VDTREGTVAGPGGSVRLEPKVMEVLTELASHRGRVVSRNELLDAVWPNVVVTEHTLTRCIYQLRTELGKIGTGPDQPDLDPIETLPKRGYRLLVNVDASPAGDSAVPQAISSVPPIPYVIGQWVRGERFYGRTAQIDEILQGHRNCIWLLGTRRVGKTSLLKQVEHIAETSAEWRFLPVFWDLQGAETPEELHLNFSDALLDADERLARIGILLEDIEADDLFVSLNKLRRRLRDKKRRLLLLCDEVEELIRLNEKDPSLLRKLRHVMQSGEDIRTVLASTIRLWALADQEVDTSPFLHGFAPPQYIARFSDDEARSLIEQDHLHEDARPQFEDSVAVAIREHCDNHPYLIQLVCKRFLETGALAEAIEHVATDRMVSYFFSVDFEMLSEFEGEIIRTIARQSPVASDTLQEGLSLDHDTLEGGLRRLENLGYLRRLEGQGYALANYFFRRWLQQTADSTVPIMSPASAASAAVGAVPAPEPDDSSPGLFAELKRRSVFRVGIAYVIVAWLLLQVGEITFGFLEIPNWAGKLLIVLLVLGLPVALILAWAFELTPEGVKRDRDVERTRS
jgi:DNA-binding winged helix-turn-helix (wHTH) protein